MQTLVTLRLSTLSNRLFWALLTAALAIRLILIITSFGSTDALLTMSWAHLSERFGIGPAYHVTPNLNHPPLSSLYMVAADRLGSRVGLEYPDMFRIFQVIADIITAAILWRLTRSREAVAFFFASPAAMFLSGFHCNADPTMIALLVAAVWMHSGGLLGVASGIKIAPIPFTPFFLIDLTWRRRVTFLLAFGIVLAAIFIPALITGGPVVLHNVFGYTGSGYEWGFCGIGFLLRNRMWAELYATAGRYVLIVALVALFAFFCRYRTPLPAMIGAALMTLNFFSPAFGIQYLVWPLPFFLFAIPRKLAYALNIALSIFTFCTYTIWAGGFPWWFADAAHNPHRELVALLALPLWLLYGTAIVVALRERAGQLRTQQLAEG